MSDNKHYIWAEEYRPVKLSEVVIPNDVRTQFSEYINQKQIPNLLLTSRSPGTGKTTSARVLCQELSIKPLFINASLNNSIDDIRTTVMQYATTMPMFGSECEHKVIILDEADRLSPAAQDALKGILEEVSISCRFILTANTKHKIVEPLRSRCTPIDFVFNKDEQQKLILQMFKRCCFILEDKKIDYDKSALAGIVKTFSPDNRGLLLWLQNEAANGKIDAGYLAKAASVKPEVLVSAMKDKKFKEVSQWIENNANGIHDDFYGKLFSLLEVSLVDQSIPEVILILAEYQKYDTVVPNKTIHFLAMCTEIMMAVKFK